MPTDGALLRVTLQSNPAQTVLYLEGELDVSTVPNLAAQVAKLNGFLTRPCVVDLESLEFVDCAGLRAFDRLSGALEAAGGRLVMTHPRPSVARVLNLVGADDWSDPAA